MKQYSALLSYLLISITLTSCTIVVIDGIGFTEPYEPSEKQLTKFARQLKIPHENIYTLDTSYWSELRGWDDENEADRHSHPIQILYFDHNGEMEQFHTSKYELWSTNKEWLQSGDFTKFPPGEAQKPFGQLNLQELSKHFNESQLSSPFHAEGYNHFVVVFWNRNFKRRSKKVIELAKENAKLDSTKSVKLIYVNTDDFFANYHMATADRKEYVIKKPRDLYNLIRKKNKTD